MSAAPSPAITTVVDHGTIVGIETSLPELVGLTEAVFQAPARIIVESDAELPAIHYVVVETTAGNDLNEVASRRGEWYRRVRTLLGTNARKVRLSVDMQP